MSNGCTTLVDDGVIRGVIATVDCQTRAYAEGGYLALTSGSSVFQAALTVLLTIYVALIGYRMLFAQGDTRLSDAPGIALRIGMILALVTSWSTFQTLVFDVADRAPAEIAAIASGPLLTKNEGSLASRPLEGLQAAYQELTLTAAAYGRVAGPEAKSYSSPQAAAAEAVGLATGVLFLSSAGVISASKLTIGVLTAVGPIFIVLALIQATRGLFVGWVRALMAAALTTLVTWLLVVLMLHVLDPWLTTLEEQRRGQTMDPQTAISAAALVFVFGAGQAALTLGALVMAMSFRLPSLTPDRSVAGRASVGGLSGNDGPSGLPQPSRAERLAYELQRDQGQSDYRSRAASLAANASAPGRQISVTLEDRPRLGDTYRRPAFSARRVEGTR